MKKYQVIARKYRPQTFKEVVGQEVVVTTLKNSLRLDKLAHAYLFCGSRGTGKTTLARLFAKALNCQNLQPDSEPCNTCSSCKEIMHGQSLDVIEIDGASNRGIDDIRSINEMVGYVPSHGKYKIYIIDEVHMLTKEAFNALLKTLEEPPAQAKFFFATTEPHKILPTILSRCQRFDLGRILPSLIISKLAKIVKDLQREIEEDALYLVAQLSDGSLRDAESLLDQLLSFVDTTLTKEAVLQMFGLVSEEPFFELDIAFSEHRLSYAFELTSQLYQQGKDPAHFMSQLIDHFRKIACCKTMGDPSLPELLATRYMQTSKQYTLQQSLYLLEYLVNQETALQRSLSPRVFLETTLLHILRTKNKIPVESLVRKLMEMKDSLSKKTLPVKESSTPIAETTPVAKPPTQEISFVHTQNVAIAQVQPETSPIAEAAPTTSTPLPKQSTPVQKETPPIQVKELPAEEKTPVQRKVLSTEEKDQQMKPQHYYDTLIRFAAVELEGSIKNI